MITLYSNIIVYHSIARYTTQYEPRVRRSAIKNTTTTTTTTNHNNNNINNNINSNSNID